MEGVFIGDLVGSAYEWTGFKSKEFPLFSAKCRVTDDSLMTCAVAEAFAKAQQEGRLGEDAYVEGLLAHFMRNIGLRYPDAGYGSKFLYWLQHKELGPYGSFGNGAAMRVAPAAYFGRTLEEVEHLAMVSARVSHNHPSAYKAAKAVAGCAFLARKGADKDGLGAYAGRYYNLHFTVGASGTATGEIPPATTRCPRELFRFLTRTPLRMGCAMRCHWAGTAIPWRPLQALLENRSLAFLRC